MIYQTGQDWRDAGHKRVMLFGMSGLGKTHIATMLRQSGTWFHYSVDYRIGTRYLGELIGDDYKRLAMQVPLLRELLMTDSVRITSNIRFDNLAPLSCWLGKPGDPARGGLPFDDYMARQDQHRAAEIQSLTDAIRFLQRAEDIYGYPHFICDTSGSICEVVSPDDPADPLMTALSAHLLPVWIEGSAAHTAELVRRFDRAPKPMYYHPDFLRAAWADYGRAHPGPVDPDAFIRWTYARALAHRQPRYAAMARHHGVTVSADEVARLRQPADFVALIASAIDRKDD
ncbi:ATPase [Paracoccus endophyticus]|uniref:ATPase n=1 Tax=Paracoccus endophyticus TaxID=2233774 RepID=UPI000DDB2F37|nr:ATPase [Paracoccus endophyticus]